MHGAALQWHIFMEPRRGFLELSFSGFFVYFYKCKAYGGLVYRKLLATKTFKTWNSSKVIKDDWERSDYFLDAEYDVVEFKNILLNISKEVFPSRQFPNTGK